MALGPADLDAALALGVEVVGAIATYYDVDAAYEQLSEIAPTTAHQEGPVTDTWQQVTEQVGRAVGRPDEAAALIGEVEAAVDALATDHPDAAGATFTFGFVTLDAVSTLRDPDDVMMTVPSGLGMTLSDVVLALPEGESFAVPVSLGQLDALDADVLALYDAGDSEARSAVESSPPWPTLPVVERGAVVDLDDGVVPTLVEAAAT